MTTPMIDEQDHIVSTYQAPPSDADVYAMFAAIPVPDDQALTASAADTTPRDYHGRWTTGGVPNLAQWADEIGPSLEGILSPEAEASQEQWVYDSKWPTTYLNEAMGDPSYQEALQANLVRLGWPDEVTIRRVGSPKGAVANGSVSPNWGSGFRRGEGKKITEFVVPRSEIVGVGHPEEGEVFFRVPAVVASAADTTPRDYHGRWTKHGDGQGYGHGPAGGVMTVDGVEVIESNSPRDSLTRFWVDQTQGEDHQNLEPDVLSHMVDWSQRFTTGITPAQRSARLYYTGESYGGINRGMRHDKWSDPNDTFSAYELRQQAFDLESSFDHGEPFAGPLFRGQKTNEKSLGSARQALEFNVGDTYVDKGFGSWSAEPNEAMFFSKTYGNPAVPDSTVLTHMRNGFPGRAIPGEPMEAEAILPPNTTYRVTRIVDFVNPSTGERHRYMEVEAS